jgi:hypothetical protein
MKKESPIIILYELMTSVDIAEGVKSRVCKYRMKFSGKNYLPQMLTKEDHEAGFNVPPYGRVGAEEILKVNKSLFGDKSNYLRRSIYFLEGQQEDAIRLMRGCIDESLTRKKEEAVKLFEIWANRHSKT